MVFRPVAVLAVALAAVTGCSGTDTPSPHRPAPSTSTTVPAPTAVTAGWEGFCAAMDGFRFDDAPAGDDLDRLDAVTDAVASAAPAELAGAAALFDAAIDAAIDAARSDGGALTPEVLYEVAPAGSEPQDALRAVFGAAEANCPAPDAGS